MFEKDIEAYRKGDRRKRHSILMKWSFVGFLVTLAGFCIEMVSGWSFISGLVALAGVLGVIAMIIAGLVNLTTKKNSLAYFNDSWGTRHVILVKWGFISFAVVLVGWVMAMFLRSPIGGTVSLVGILLTICLTMVAMKNFQSGPD